MKNYCDKCKKVDVECGVMIELNTQLFKYTNLKKTLFPKYDEIEKTLNRSFASFSPVTFCDECFIEFFDYAKTPKLEDTESDNQ